jgi:uncharacterized protein YndB with AHSA1/START domain
MNKGTKGEVVRYIAAPAETVYDLVTDVTRMGEWSPECFRGEWVDGAAGPAVGARFRGSSKRGLVRWSTTPRVVTADRPRAFGFVTTHRGHEETMWTYRLVPQGDGTTVTETFEMLADLPWYLRLVERVAMGVKDRRADLVAGMAETLRRLGAAAEAERSVPPSLQSTEA